MNVPYLDKFSLSFNLLINEGFISIDKSVQSTQHKIAITLLCIMIITLLSSF